MAHSKSNLGRLGPSLAYSIDAAGVLHWHGECDFLAGDLLIAPSTADERSLLDEAVDFLRETLANGSVSTKEVDARAAENGITKSTLRRAKDRLGVVRAPQAFKGAWVLSLPIVAQGPAQLLIPSP
jgi:hypothetical protein